MVPHKLIALKIFAYQSNHFSCLTTKKEDQLFIIDIITILSYLQNEGVQSAMIPLT